MSRFWVRAVVGMVLTLNFVTAGPVAAQRATEADKLNAEVKRLYGAGNYAEAIPLAQRVLAIREKALGPKHPEVGTWLNNLALLYENLGRYEEAQPLYERSLVLFEMELVPGPQVPMTLGNLARIKLKRGDLIGAAGAWQRATEEMSNSAVDPTEYNSSKLETRNAQRFVAGQIKATQRLAAERRVDAMAAATDTFVVAQFSGVSEAAVALAQMAMRSVSAKPELASLVRERQDRVVAWRAGKKLPQPDPTFDHAAMIFLSGPASDDARIFDIDRILQKDFPDYDALRNPRPATVADVQVAIRDDEAFVLFLDTDDHLKPLPEETFVWVVTRTGVRWVRSDLGTAALKREVGALRCGLDATSWNGDGTERCANLPKLPLNKAPADGEALPFDAVRAHALYRSLLGEARDLIAGKHLLIVPSGALTTLPFQVLVTEPPTSKDLSSVRWLIRDHAITVLPSVASLAALRRTGKPSAAPKAMIGFGNPLLNGNQAHPQYSAYFKQQAAIARAQTGCATILGTRTAALRVARRSVASVPQTSRLADLNFLRALTPLPETADELCEVVRTVGGNVDDVWIGARATEAEVKRLSASGELAKYKILHFATHGTLAGQLSGINEPGLILTPPATATANDDGYLSGSEIAALKLDADWVILSACNTAGGAGEDSAAEALSGLARMFFYAGARALLVSHWEVDSDAAVKLVTAATGALSKEPGIGRADALRRAMLKAMADNTRPADWVPASHPSVWAPFVVVGEGGAGR